MTRSSILILLAITGVTIALWLWYLNQPFPDVVKRKQVPIIFLNQVRSKPPFSATVESIHFGFRDTISNGLFSYVTILVKMPDGKELGLCENHPDSNMALFAERLVRGQTYEFPAALPSSAK